MSYPMKWEGMSDPDDESGVARFMVEGEEFVFSLPTFRHAQQLGDMLDLAFAQGKQFAARVMRSHVESAMDNAVSTHDLRVTAGVPAARHHTGAPADADGGAGA